MGLCRTVSEINFFDLSRELHMFPNLPPCTSRRRDGVSRRKGYQAVKKGFKIGLAV